MKNSKSNRHVAALAKRCGITEGEACRAIDGLIHGNAVLYRALISSRRAKSVGGSSRA